MFQYIYGLIMKISTFLIFSFTEIGMKIFFIFYINKLNNIKQNNKNEKIKTI